MADALLHPVTPVTSLASAAKAPATTGDPAKDAAIYKKAKEFESMVVAQMLQPMFENIDKDSSFTGGQGEEMFKPMLIEQYAKAMSQGRGIGVADAIAREMIGLQMRGAQAAAQPAAAAQAGQAAMASTQKQGGADGAGG